MQKLNAEQAETLRVAVYEYSHALTNASAYRIRALMTPHGSQTHSEYVAASKFWQDICDADKAKLAALGVVL